MKIGIDSYCYHRFFGEVYPFQNQPPKTMTLEDFIDRAKQLGVDGVSLESCFVDQRDDAGYMKSIKQRLDDHALDRVWAWGHPDGLEGGKNSREFKQMLRAFDQAAAIGADVMRIVGSSFTFRFENHQEQIDHLADMLQAAVLVAKDHGIKMAVENHIDFTADECLQLIERVGPDWLGINFDTGNFARLLDDPIDGMKKLAPHVLATHIKDLKVCPQRKVTDWCFFACTPTGDGFINNLELARLLKAAGYEGFLAMEIDYLHPDYHEDEDAAVVQSVKVLRKIAEQVESE
jgi:sugar phosphate isomerase/epimerase